MGFKELNSINVTSKIERKNGFNYLSWAVAWEELKKVAPEATYRVFETAEGLPYFKSEEGYFVKVGVTVGGIEHVSYLPVMDLRNKALKTADAMDINKAIQRCLVKAIALHGLGLYLYTGEDLPASESATKAVKTESDVETYVPDYVQDPTHSSGGETVEGPSEKQLGAIRAIMKAGKWSGDISKLTKKQAFEIISASRSN